jgi:hypothetical protein
MMHRSARGEKRLATAFAAEVSDSVAPVGGNLECRSYRVALRATRGNRLPNGDAPNY